MSKEERQEDLEKKFVIVPIESLPADARQRLESEGQFILKKELLMMSAESLKAMSQGHYELSDILFHCTKDLFS